MDNIRKQLIFNRNSAASLAGDEILLGDRLYRINKLVKTRLRLRNFLLVGEVLILSSLYKYYVASRYQLELREFFSTGYLGPLRAIFTFILPILLINYLTSYLLISPRVASQLVFIREIKRGK